VKNKRQFRQFLKMTSDWKVFSYKFYELEIYPAVGARTAERSIMQMAIGDSRW